MSERENDEESEEDRQALGCLAETLGCGAEGCATFALPCVLIMLFLFLR